MKKPPALLLAGLVLCGATFLLRTAVVFAPSRQEAEPPLRAGGSVVSPVGATPFESAGGSTQSHSSPVAAPAVHSLTYRDPAGIAVTAVADGELAAPMAERRAARSPDSLERIRQPTSVGRSRAAALSQDANLVSPSADLVFELAPGMQAPGANAQTDPALRLTPEQEAIKDWIADHFVAEIDEAVAAAGAEPETIGPAWNSAQQRADNRLRQMLGDRTFVQQSAAAAKEALRQR